ncbi:hypothetical protein [Brevibacillus laterosporus]
MKKYLVLITTVSLVLLSSLFTMEITGKYEVNNVASSMKPYTDDPQG